MDLTHGHTPWQNASVYQDAFSRFKEQKRGCTNNKRYLAFDIMLSLLWYSYTAFYEISLITFTWTFILPGSIFYIHSLIHPVDKWLHWFTTTHYQGKQLGRCSRWQGSSLRSAKKWEVFCCCMAKQDNTVVVQQYFLWEGGHRCLWLRKYCFILSWWAFCN